MTGSTHDTGTAQVLLERLLNYRLPRTIALKKRVDAGERMTDADMGFLKSALEDAQNGLHFVARNPQFQAIGTQIVQLYGDIITRATQNEKRD